MYKIYSANNYALYFYYFDLITVFVNLGVQFSRGKISHTNIFQGLNWPGPNLLHQHFPGVQFAGARFAWAQFATPGAQIAWAPFAGTQFAAKKLQGAQFA